jgi:hypothetical protein
VATLNGAITADQELIRVTGAAPPPGSYLTVDSEAIRFNGATRGAQGRGFTRDYWSVDRGVAGTTKATHSNGATLAQYYPDAAGASGGADFPAEWTVGTGGSLYIAVTDGLASPGVFENSGYGLQIDNNGALILYPNKTALTDGTSALVLIYTDQGGIPVFKISADGSVHIKTGTSIVADL